jgi:hypothetical protein
MKHSILRSVFLNNYFGLLKNLSPEHKLALIKRLSTSIKSSKKPLKTNINDLFGAFVSDSSADEIISEIKGTRNFSRQVD